MDDAQTPYLFLVSYNTALTEDERAMNRALSTFGRLERVFPGLFLLVVDAETADREEWSAIEIADKLGDDLGDSFAAVVFEAAEIVTVGEIEDRSVEILESLAGAEEE